MATTTFEQRQQSGQGEDHRLVLTRVFRASRQRVFDAWTRPEFIRQWFAPEEMTLAEVEMEPRVGGAYRMMMQGPTKEAGSPEERERRTGVTGRYTRVEPYDVLAFTWQGEWAQGEESLVTIELRDVEGGTEMTLTHDRFLTDASRAGHEKGWTSTLGKLQEFAERND